MRVIMVYVEVNRSFVVRVVIQNYVYDFVVLSDGLCLLMDGFMGLFVVLYGFEGCC